MGSRDRSWSTDPHAAEDGTPAPVPEAVDGLSGDDERRRVAVAVAEADGPVSVDALATMLAARDRGRPPERLRATDRCQARRALAREHLPALCAHGALERTDDGRYAPGPALAPLLRAVDAASASRG